MEKSKNISEIISKNKNQLDEYLVDFDPSKIQENLNILL